MLDPAPVAERKGINLPMESGPCSVTKVSFDPSVDRCGAQMIGNI
jgi:hypothetical protein